MNFINRLNRIKKNTHLFVRQVFPPIKPSAICIGAQKAGTTALFNYMANHPDVKPSIIKEINFFNCTSHYSRGIAFYHSHFPRRFSANNRYITIDVTPGYLAAADRAAKRIHEYNPDIRLIVLLRNPITRAYSAWQMYRKFYINNRDWFYNWVRKCDSSVQRDFYIERSSYFGQDFRKDITDEIKAMQSGRVIEMPILLLGMYYRHIKYYFDLFPQSHILIISSETFKRDTKRCLSQIEEFIGLKPNLWNSKQLVPQFTGAYDSELSTQDIILLRSFYREQNLALFNLTKQEFNWD